MIGIENFNMRTPMPAGKPLTEDELKALPEGAKVHLIYTHPDPTANKHNGVAYVEHIDDGVRLLIGGRNSAFSMCYEYSSKALVEEEGPDGDTLALYHYTKKK